MDDDTGASILFQEWVTSIERYWVTSGEQRSFPNAVALYTAFILQTLWNWFVVPATNLPPISFLLMYGLRIFTSIMFENGGPVALMEFYWGGFLKLADQLTPEPHRNALTGALNEIAEGEFGWAAKKLIWRAVADTINLGVGLLVHILI